MDSDGPSLSLCAWLQYKVTKMPQRPTLVGAHFHSTTEPCPETVSLLNQYIEKFPISIHYVQCNLPTSQSDLFRTYCDNALKHGCNKVAVADTLDFLNAQTLGNMFTEGVFNGPPAVQNIQISPEAKEISIIRPLCYVTDDELASFSQKNGFPSHPTSIRIEEPKHVTVAREAVNYMSTEANNIRMNIFHSQFAIQEKYLGTGDGKVHNIADACEEC